MTAIAPGTPPPGPASRRSPSRHLLAGAASVLVSGMLGISWLWVSLTLVTTGIGMLPAALTGIPLLVLWVVLMRWAVALERRRAHAAHGIDVMVPARTVSTRPGAGGWFATLWFDVCSWSFWRGVLHHHVVMIVGLLVASAFWVAVGITWALGESAVVAGSGEIGSLHLGLAGLLGAGLAALVVALASLAIGVVIERALGRAMLPTADDALRDEVAELGAQRRGAIDAATAERLRIERDLHDGIQPRFVALAMTLGMARPKIATDPARAEELVAEAHEESKAIMTELRQLARGIHPAVLTDRGLDAALSALAARSPVPVDLHVDLAARPGTEAEAVAYFVVSEALTNVAKHARATSARVDVRGDAERLVVHVEDDGVGGAALSRDGVSTGLAGLTDRVRATGGRLDIASAPGAGTRLSATIPLAPDAARTDITSTDIPSTAPTEVAR